MTKIEWATETWNPITGCTPISEGCRYCYAARMAKRLAGRFGYPKEDPFRPGNMRGHRINKHTGDMLINNPRYWKNPRLIFVCSMGDLFHEHVGNDAIFTVWQRAVEWPQHTFIFLTKRPERMLKFFEIGGKAALPNVLLGVTVENQEQADRRIPILLSIPAAVRFVSVEPMLGPVDLTAIRIPTTGPGSSQPCAPPTWHIVKPLIGYEGKEDWHGRGAGHVYPRLDWVICGGETGPQARIMETEWALSLRDQCVDASVPFFFKKHGDAWCKRFDVSAKSAENRTLDGQVWEQYPAAVHWR